MDYNELEKMVGDPLNITTRSRNAGRSVEHWLEMPLQDFWEGLFWRGTTQADDGDLWESDPTGDFESRGHPTIHYWDPIVKFQHEGKQYEMKVVEAFNQNIKAGEKVWWMTKEYKDPSIPNPPKEWHYATTIELTREGDPDVLRIWQTYGEPDGIWEWDLQKFGNPATINYLRLK